MEKRIGNGGNGERGFTTETLRRGGENRLTERFGAETFSIGRHFLPLILLLAFPRSIIRVIRQIRGLFLSAKYCQVAGALRPIRYICTLYPKALQRAVQE